MRNQISLNEAIIKHIKKGIYPFHVPGHKGGKLLNIDKPFQSDLTEIPGLDNLYEPSGAILESQNLMAELFGSDECFFSINGGSAGIIAAIMALCNEDGKIIMQRNSHVSAYNGLVLSGTNPVFVYPEIMPEYDIAGGINVAEIKNAILENDNVQAIFISNPTYEGFTSNIEEIIRIAHDNDIPIIIDEAHGSHFKFNSDLPKSGVEYKADLVIQCHHKTLGVMGQGAVIHLCGKRVSPIKFKMMLNLIQTTSPSYLIMSSIDISRKKLENIGINYIFELISNIQKLRKKLSGLNNFKLLGKELIGKYSIYDIDISRLTFAITNFKTDSYSISKILFKKYKFQLELVSEKHFIAVTTIADSKTNLDEFATALIEIDNEISSSKLSKNTNINNSSMLEAVMNNKPTALLKPRVAAMYKHTHVSLSSALNRVSGSFVFIYPPGIPILSPGESISQGVIDLIKKYISDKRNIIGVQYNEYIMVLDGVFI